MGPKLLRPSVKQLRGVCWREPAIDPAELAREIKQLRDGLALIAKEIKALEEQLADKRHMHRQILSAIGSRVNTTAQ